MSNHKEVISMSWKNESTAFNASASFGPWKNMTREEFILHRQHEEQEMRRALLIFYLVLFCLFFAQSGLVMWRKRHKRSYELVTLLGLWLIPPIISFHLSYWRFVAVWLGYSSVTLYYLWACSFKRLNKSLPKQVYRWFLGIFKLSIAVGFSGYVLLILEVFGLGVLLHPFLNPVTALVAIWYGLYYGILSRDSAEVASDRIAAMLGTGRKMAVSVRDCGICGGELADGVGPAVSRGEEDQAGGDKTVQLSCKHLFHEECIRGWTIVGKKDTCPTCWEKVDLRSLYADRPWETRNLSWIQMLDMVRYLVVWNPVILTGMHFAFHLVGLDHEDEAHHGSSAGMSNGTLLSNTTFNATEQLLRAFF